MSHLISISIVLLISHLKVSSFYFISTCVLSTHVAVHQCVQCPQRSEEGDRSTDIEAKDGCELPCRSWELVLDPLEEQLVLLNTETSL